jgi:hypothetical protein
MVGATRVRIGRRCHECGATTLETTFPGTRKPTRQPDRCTDCAADPLAVSELRVAARRAEIERLRAAGRYRAPRPFATMPLFSDSRS